MVHHPFHRQQTQKAQVRKSSFCGARGDGDVFCPFANLNRKEEMPLNVYDRVLNRIEKYALVFSAVVLFFIIVSTVFSTSIMRVGDRDMVLEKPKSHYGYADDIVDFQNASTNPESTANAIQNIPAIVSNRSFAQQAQAVSATSATQRSTAAPTAAPQTTFIVSC